MVLKLKEILFSWKYCSQGVMFSRSSVLKEICFLNGSQFSKSLNSQCLSINGSQFSMCLNSQFFNLIYYVQGFQPIYSVQGFQPIGSVTVLNQWFTIYAFSINGSQFSNFCLNIPVSILAMFNTITNDSTHSRQVFSNYLQLDANTTNIKIHRRRKNA